MTDTIKVSLWELDDYCAREGLELTGKVWTRDGDTHVVTRLKTGIEGKQNDSNRDTQTTSRTDNPGGAPGTVGRIEPGQTSGHSQRAEATTKPRREAS